MNCSNLLREFDENPMPWVPLSVIQRSLNMSDEEFEPHLQYLIQNKLLQVRGRGPEREAQLNPNVMEWTVPLKPHN